jgi:hypothetical protein
MTPSKPHLPRAWSVGLRMVLTVGLLLPSGCTSWRTQSKPVDELLSTQPSTRARLILADWSMVEVRQAQVSGDTLWGYWEGRTRGPSRPPAVAPDGRVGYPVGEVRAVQFEHLDVAASALTFVGFIVIGTVGVSLLATALQGDR